MRRRTLLGAAALLPLGARVASAAPPAETITPALVEAAKKEGKVVYYTSIDLSAAERLAKAFEAKYPGIPVRVERSGAERVFQRAAGGYSAGLEEGSPTVGPPEGGPYEPFVVPLSHACRPAHEPAIRRAARCLPRSPVAGRAPAMRGSCPSTWSRPARGAARLRP